jgi:hypothetical protein
LRRTHAPWGDAPLEALPDRGLAHLHVRLAGLGLLARIPKQSQVGLPPAANLAHQQACFERCAASGHTPRLLGVLPVDPDLPRGALLVEHILGRPVALPGDLPAMAQALAAIHALDLPESAHRAPLADAADPLQRLRADIGEQARHLDAASPVPEVRGAILEELDALDNLLQCPDRPARRLIAFDAHPGNFLVTADGQAVLVDLEKCRYGAPGLDLAHATLYTSTTWDAAASAVLSPDDVLAFYRAWEAACGLAVAADARRWHLALRRAMWLWSVTWCCKWRALSGQAPQASPMGEDWSAAHSADALVAHVRDRVDDYLAPAAVRFVREELAHLTQALAA